MIKVEIYYFITNLKHYLLKVVLSFQGPTKKSDLVAKYPLAKHIKQFVVVAPMLNHIADSISNKSIPVNISFLFNTSMDSEFVSFHIRNIQFLVI